MVSPPLHSKHPDSQNKTATSKKNEFFDAFIGDNVRDEASGPRGRKRKIPSSEDLDEGSGSAKKRKSLRAARKKTS